MRRERLGGLYAYGNAIGETLATGQACDTKALYRAAYGLLWRATTFVVGRLVSLMRVIAFRQRKALNPL